MWNNNNMCPLTKDGYYSKNAIKLGLINSVSIFPVIRHPITQSIPGTSPRNHISVSWNYVEDRVTCNYSVTPSVIQGALWSDYSHTPKQSQHFTLSNCHPHKPWVTISLLNCLYVCLFVCVCIYIADLRSVHRVSLCVCFCVVAPLAQKQLAHLSHSGCMNPPCPWANRLAVSGLSSPSVVAEWGVFTSPLLLLLSLSTG